MNLHHLSNPQQHTNEHERTGPPAVCSTDWIKTRPWVRQPPTKNPLPNPQTTKTT
jgi:hypothetical protein